MNFPFWKRMVTTALLTSISYMKYTFDFLAQVSFTGRSVFYKKFIYVICFFALLSFISFTAITPSVKNTDDPVVSPINGGLFLPDGFRPSLLLTVCPAVQGILL